MSRIGKKIINIPTNVTVNFDGNKIKVTGPLGTLERDLRPEISYIHENGVLTFFVKEETKDSNAYFGLTRALVNNMVDGVSKGFEKKLELEGVGYRVKLNGNDLNFTLGFSHPVDIKAPAGIKFEVDGNTKFVVKGVDKELVGQVASNIRKLRKPEPYKGKGIRYAGEVVRRKAGKSAAKGK
ncbi:MAG: 50S ribosomal protein L6 [Proteobacteria bacterium]|nr:50S ribosomal protein L6 [Pseudomonadota bacterium]